jgi:positive regulator of sigma E activity
MVYMFPLLMTLLGAIAGHLFLGGGADHQPEVLLAAAGGLALASLILRLYHRRVQRDRRYQPVILRQAVAVQPVAVRVETPTLKGF